MTDDIFAFEPNLWFGLLCHGVSRDQAGRISIQQVFSQVRYQSPPKNTGVPPHAYLNGYLVVGFTSGLGHYEATVDLLDIQDNVLWSRPDGAWAFDLGPASDSAVLVQQVQYWFTQQGQYRFRVSLAPTGSVHMVQFAALPQIGLQRGEPTDPEADSL